MSPSRKVDKDISPTTIFSWITQTVILCYELSDQEAHTLHQVKAHDVGAFVASKAFQLGVSLDPIRSLVLHVLNKKKKCDMLPSGGLFAFWD